MKNMKLYKKDLVWTESVVYELVDQIESGFITRVADYDGEIKINEDSVLHFIRSELKKSKSQENFKSQARKVALTRTVISVFPDCDAETVATITANVYYKNRAKNSSKLAIISRKYNINYILGLIAFSLFNQFFLVGMASRFSDLIILGWFKFNLIAELVFILVVLAAAINNEVFCKKVDSFRQYLLCIFAIAFLWDAVTMIMHINITFS